MIERPHLDKVLGYIEAGRSRRRARRGRWRRAMLERPAATSSSRRSSTTSTTTMHDRARGDLRAGPLDHPVRHARTRACALANDDELRAAASVYTNDLDTAFRVGARAARRDGLGQRLLRGRHHARRSAASRSPASAAATRASRRSTSTPRRRRLDHPPRLTGPSRFDRAAPEAGLKPVQACPSLSKPGRARPANGQVRRQAMTSLAYLGAGAFRASNPSRRASPTVSRGIRLQVNAVAMASHTGASSQYALCDFGKSRPEWTRRSTTLARPSDRRKSGSATNERKSRLSYTLSHGTGRIRRARLVVRHRRDRVERVQQRRLRADRHAGLDRRLRPAREQVDQRDPAEAERDRQDRPIAGRPAARQAAPEHRQDRLAVRW